jgi:ParB/RepB/Spo0J family partition protein
MINLPINGQVTDVHISHLIADPDQPRKTFAEDSLQALSDSIAKSGILVPLLVRRAEADGMLIIHDGERRYRAAQLAKLETVPVIVTEAGEDIRLEQFAMNNLREHLKPIEVARMLADMQRKQFASTNDIAAHLDRTGLPAMTPKQIEETIALVDLPDWLQDMIDAGEVEAEDALQVQKVVRFPEVLEEVRETFKDNIALGGKLTDHDVGWAINSVVRNAGIELTTETWRSNPATFSAAPAPSTRTIASRCGKSGSARRALMSWWIAFSPSATRSGFLSPYLPGCALSFDT